MAIQKLERNPETGKYEPVGEPEYVGCCLFTTADYNVRKMSDIWADDFYMVVWTGNGTKRVFTHSNFEIQHPAADAQVDATPEVKAAYAEWKAEQDRLAAERARRNAEAEAKQRAEQWEKDCERLAKSPVRDSTVRVIKGRKVPVGTEGEVVWKGDDRWNGGTRIGIRDASGKVQYTNSNNAERIDVVKDDDQTWAEYWQARNDNLPGKNSMVRINNSGQVGKVFWMQGSRIGVAMSPNKGKDGRNTDVGWCLVDQVTTLHGDEAEAARAEWEAKATPVAKPSKPRTEDIVVPF